MSIVVAIGVVLLIFGLLSRKEAFLLKALLLLTELFLICVTMLAVNRKDDIFLQIPGTSIENAAVIEVGNSGTMYLDSSQSAYMDNKFFLSDGDKGGVADWLQNTKKNVFIYIAQGSKILYKRNLGTYESGMESEIWSIYNSWKSGGSVPSDSIRYWLLFFYLEV